MAARGISRKTAWRLLLVGIGLLIAATLFAMFGEPLYAHVRKEAAWVILSSAILASILIITGGIRLTDK
jgi:uncharacterized membrane protein